MVAYGIPFLIKLGECAHGRGIAMVWYTPLHGEEPPKHVHDSEDEVFYIQRAVDVCVKKSFIQRLWSNSIACRYTIAVV